MNGLAHINIELTSRCNKSCWMCGRRKLERNYPELVNWGDIPFDMLKLIAKQIPAGVVVQLHWNGEPTLYPELKQAIRLFRHCITQFDTNGKLLVEKAHEIIGYLDILTLSVIQDDPEAGDQKRVLQDFLKLKKRKKPMMVYRLLGDVDDTYWQALHGVVAKRALHSPDMSRDYEREPTRPEIGICMDLLHSCAIDRYGNVSACVRFDPQGIHRIGHVEKATLEEIWTSQHVHKWHDHPRMVWVQMHKMGLRNRVPLCRQCHYWGVPTGGR